MRPDRDRDDGVGEQMRPPRCTRCAPRGTDRRRYLNGTMDARTNCANGLCMYDELSMCGVLSSRDYSAGGRLYIQKGCGSAAHAASGMGVAHSHYTPPGSAAATHAAALIVFVVDEMQVSNQADGGFGGLG